MTAIAAGIGPGERKAIRVPVCTLVSGIDVYVTFYVVRGAQPRPTLGLLSTSHGAEFLSIEQIRVLLESVDARDLRGTIIPCPVANPIALEQSRVTTPTDEVNMNRVYPGPSGDALLAKYAGGVTEYLAHLVTANLIDPCDVLFDFHLGPWGHAIETIDVPTQADAARMERLRRQASLFETASIHEWELFSGSGVGYAVGRSKLAPGIEIGGGFGNAQGIKWIQQAVRGMRSAMQHLGMLPGELRWPESVVVVTGRAGMRPKHGGYHVPEIDVDALGTTVEAGQLLGRTYDTQSLALPEELRSPYRGLLYMVRAYGLIHPGDWGYIVGDERRQRVYRPGAGG